MTYYGAKEIADAFRTVRKNTLTVAEDIPEDKYGFRPSPTSRSVAETFAHIALSTRIALAIHRDHKLKDLSTLDFMTVMGPIMAEEHKPRNKAEIIELLKSEGDSFAGFVDSADEAFLTEVVAFPPQAQQPSKTRFEMLLGPKEHEMHHRGQLMLVERMLGVTPHLTRQQEARMAQYMAARK